MEYLFGTVWGKMRFFLNWFATLKVEGLGVTKPVCDEERRNRTRDLCDQAHWTTALLELYKIVLG